MISWAGINLIILLAAGGLLVLFGDRRPVLPVRRALRKFLDTEQKIMGPVIVSAGRLFALRLLAFPAGLAAFLFLYPFGLQPAVLIGSTVFIAGLLWPNLLTNRREAREAHADVLPLFVHIRLALAQSQTVRDALYHFTVDIEPGRVLARRITDCLAAAATGVDLYDAFQTYVARDNRHLQLLGDLLRDLDRAVDPGAALDRSTGYVLRECSTERRITGQKKAMAGVMLTVVGLFPALLLAVLEPTLWMLIQSFI